MVESEGRLISTLRSRDEEAFAAVVTEQYAALIRMAMRYVANKETAEEVVQETWVAVIQGVTVLRADHLSADGSVRFSFIRPKTEACRRNVSAPSRTSSVKTEIILTELTQPGFDRAVVGMRGGRPSRISWTIGPRRNSWQPGKPPPACSERSRCCPQLKKKSLFFEMSAAYGPKRLVNS
jgi:hypothetical protein